MRKVASSREMRRIERSAIERGLTEAAMIERAGMAIATFVAERAQNGHITVLAGPGNNGSDGLNAAERLRRAGHTVTVYGFRRAGRGVYEGSMMVSEEDRDRTRLTQLASSSSVVVDALLGIGQSRPPDGPLSSILGTIREALPSGVNTVAVDIPTGVDADTGAITGEAFRAHTTLCMGFLKRGAVLSPGKEFSGNVLTVDVGIPADLDDVLCVSMPGAQDVANWLPHRQSDGNKGSYGRLVVIGGSRDYVGAPALVALGAYRSGAGLVELALPRSIQHIVATHLLEAIYHPLPEADGQIAASGTELHGALGKASALVFGPGIGVSETTCSLTVDVLQATEATEVPSVIDADGLNCLAHIPQWWQTTAPLILTPHPGEMSRLTGRSVADIQRNRVEAALHYADRWQKIVVLKGEGTVIASPTGQAAINPTGGPNLSTAGTGDVLSGVLGSLLAQGRPLWEAAVAGTYLHGAAGDILRNRHGDSGTLAGDLPRAIPDARVSILREAGVSR